ncbi:MAG: hypothetical protein WCX22_06310 [Methanoregula sp.]
MKHWHMLSYICLAVVVLLVMSVSVQPAMAAQATNEILEDCTACSTGTDSMTSIPGLENKNIPTINIREISPEFSLLASGGGTSGEPATITGTQKRRINAALTLDIQDPFSESKASSIILNNETGDITDIPVAAVIRNMSQEGYDLTGQSVHRYESVVTSDDILAMNTSQKSALDAEGFTMTADDTVQSYRDVSYYTFTNRTTDSLVYLMKIQQLDSQGNPIGEPALSLSPEFSPSGTRVATSSFSTSSSGSNSCVMEWIAVILAAVLLILNIVLISAGTGGAAGAVILAAVGIILARLTGNMGGADGGRTFSERVWTSGRPALAAAEVISGLILLAVLIYSIYELGVCMGWWGEDDFIWTYQYRFNETANNANRTLFLHDRFALALYADTHVDENGKWIAVSHPGLKIKEELVAKADDDSGSIQSWLVEATEPGTHDFTLRYETSQPVPPSIKNNSFTLHFTVKKGEWNIFTLADTGNGRTPGAYPSLSIDPSGKPRVSFYDSGIEKIRYGERPGKSWTIDTVGDSAGTYSTSLAFNPIGKPAISYGDGTHSGNMMYAQKKDTSEVWGITIVDEGTNGALGNTGQYSSLAFSPADAMPRIMYNDGLTSGTLKEAVYDHEKGWMIEKKDGGRDLFASTGYGVSLKIDTGGHSHVAYTEGNYFGNLKYAEDTGGAYYTITTVDNGGGGDSNTGRNPSLALDTKEYSHIAYYDSTNEDLRYASWDGTQWVLETVDSMGDVGGHPSLAIDNSDRPHISYYGATSKELKYATRDAGSTEWVIRTVDNDGDVGQYSSIALDPSGNPWFAYYDATNHALKFAEWTT